LKFAAGKQNKQFSLSVRDNTPLTDTQSKKTADNPHVNPKNGIKNGKQPKFDPAPGAKAPQKGENGKNAAKQNLTQIPAEQPSVVQAWLAQYSLNIQHGKEGVARKVEPKAGYELAQSLKNLRKEIAFAHTVQPTKTQISETVPIVNQNQIGPKTTLDLILKKPSNEGEPPNGIRISNTKLAASRGDADQQSVKVPNLKSLIDAQSETKTANVKPAVTGKPVVSSIPKVPASNTSFPPVEDKSSYFQSQPVRISQEKSPSIADKAAGNKTTTSQQGPILPEPSVDNKATAGQSIHPGTQRLSGPPAEEEVEPGKNSPGNPVPQKLHHIQFQVSLSQIKDRGSSASNNNSDSGFKQILAPDNAETFLTEQTSALPEAAKADNLPTQTSPSDVSESITKQILESIHNHSSQQSGSQQITIRLNPPELGKVFIQFEEQENQITGLLQVSKAQTRYEVEQALPHIIQNLADSGIQIKRLEVMLTDQGEQQHYRDETLQDGTFQQHHEFSQEGNPDNHGTIVTNEPVINRKNDNYQDSLETGIQITDNSINILI
jgi:flagellar hook-length control protein FliK